MNDRIQKVILAFEKASATRDIEKLDKILHQEYRVTANKFKGTQDVTVFSKEGYLKMTADGKIGGASYETDFLNISITQHTAMAEILFRSDTNSNMHKYLFLIQTKNDEWQVIGDLPLVID